MINIKGIDKAVLLHALVINGRTLGLGALQARPFSVEEAQKWIDENRSHDGGFASSRQLYFDYVCGVPVKSDLSEDQVDPWGYDRDQGQGAFQRVVDKLREEVPA
jgi:hypothetical protein